MNLRSPLFALVAAIAVLAVSPCTPAAHAAVSVQGQITTDTIWTESPDSIYVVEQTVDVMAGATLTIEPGVIVLFQNTRALNVYGGLVTSGDDSTQVVFTSVRDPEYGGTNPARNAWAGIRVQAGSTGAVLDHAVVRYADQAVQVNNANAELNETILEQCYTFGLRVQTAATATVRGGTVRNITLDAVSIASEGFVDVEGLVVDSCRYGVGYAESASLKIRWVDNEVRNSSSYGFFVDYYYSITNIAPETELRGNLFVDTGYAAWVLPPNVVDQAIRENMIEGSDRAKSVFTGGTFSRAQARWDAGYAVHADGLTVNAGSALDLAPGTVYKFYSSSSGLSVYGSLHAAGTADSLVVITSGGDDSAGGDTNGNGPSSGAQGQWRGIYAYDGGFLDLDHTRVSYGGNTYGYAIYSAASAVVEIDDSTVRDNTGYGLYVAGTTTVRRSTVSGNGSDGIYHNRAGGEVRLESVVLSGNGRDGLRFQGGTTPANYGDLYLYDVVSENNAGNGIYTFSTPPLQMEQTRALNNVGYGFAIPPEAVTLLWEEALQNDAVGNGRDNAVLVTPGIIETDATWIDEYAYVVQGKIEVLDQVKWTLEPGTILKFLDEGRVLVRGLLLAEGEQGSEVVFTSFEDDTYLGDTDGVPGTTGEPGDWYGLSFIDSDPGTAISRTIIRNAGRPYCAWESSYVVSGVGRIDGSYAITVAGSSSRLDVSNTQFRRIAIDPSNCDYRYYSLINGTLRVFENARVTVSESEFADSDNYGITSYSSNLVARDNVFVRTVPGGIVHMPTGAGGVIVGNQFLECGAGWGALSTVVLDSFEHNLAQDNAYGFAVRAEQVPKVWLDNTLGPNLRGNPIGVTGGTIATNTSWIAHDGADFAGNYVLFQADVNVSDATTFALQPGTTLKFRPNIGMKVSGVLVAEGTQAEPIVFTSYYDDEYGGNSSGDASPVNPWKWLWLDDPELGSSLSHVVFRYPGYSAYNMNGANRYAGLVITGNGARVDVTNCVFERQLRPNASYEAAMIYTAPTVTLNLSESVIRDNVRDGLLAYGTTNLVDCTGQANGAAAFKLLDGSGVMSGNTATGNSGYGYYVHPNRVDEVTLSNTNTANGFLNSIYVTGGIVSDVAEWAAGSPLRIGADVFVASGNTLTLTKGTIAKFDPNAGMYVDGKIVGLATPVDKIVLTSVRDDNFGGDLNDDGANSSPAPGDWQGVILRGGNVESQLSWTQISYAGGSNSPALHLQNSGGAEYVFNEILVTNNATCGIQVDDGARAKINVSDIYGNTVGLKNLNAGATVDARGSWWGHPTGPFEATANPGGQGDSIQGSVDFSNPRGASIDNPWTVFASPASTGNFQDAQLVDLDGNDLRDLVIATEANGLRIYTRTGVESWALVTSPMPSNQITSLQVADLNGDGVDDVVAGGPLGLSILYGNGSALGSPVDVGGGINVSDVVVADVDQDFAADLVAVSGSNAGVFVFYGDGAGNWSAPDRPNQTLSYNRVQVRDVDDDTLLDIVATNAENFGIHTWRQSPARTWTAQPYLDNGKAYYGLTTGYVDADGFVDIVAGANEPGVGIRVFLGDGTFDWSNWAEIAGPTSGDLFNDLELRDLNADGRLDLAAASQGTGVRVWLGTSALNWNYWYHPIENGNFRSVTLDDLNLDGSTDMFAVAQNFGISLWANNNPATFQDVFVVDEERLDFGDVAVGQCGVLEFTLTNDSADTLETVLVYTTDAQFDVQRKIEAGAVLAREAGPLQMMPGEEITFTVDFCPTLTTNLIEAVIIRSTSAITNVRLTGRGVPAIEPVWFTDVLVTNAPADTLAGVHLTFGAGIGATAGIDALTAEQCLPPLPPAGVFDARLLVGDCGAGGGSLLDLHDVYNIDDQWTIGLRRAVFDEPVTLRWDPEQLPAGTFVMQTFPPIEPAVDMQIAGEYVVTNPAVEQVTITSTIFSTFTYEFRNGWQLASLPVTTQSDTASVIFPDAAYLWEFDPDTDQYAQPELIAPGIGYWLKSDGPDTSSVEGLAVRELVLGLAAGWNLIGSIEDTLSTDQILQDPPNAVQSIYGFDLAYYAPDRLVPGQGYWINVSGPAVVTLDADPLARGRAGNVAALSDAQAIHAAVAAAEWILPITLEVFAAEDLLGRRMLHVGTADDATAGLDAQLGEAPVPPVPPRGGFDVRLVDGSGIALHRDLRSVDDDAVYRLLWQLPETATTVRISWDVESLPTDGVLVLTDGADGRFLQELELDANGHVVLSGPVLGLGSVRIERRSGAATTPMPARVSLHGNAPNPFNPATTVKFAMPSQGTVRIAIYDVAGRLVRTLVNEDVAAGEHEITWFGRDDRGEPVSSGTYLLRMNASGLSFTRKMSLIK